MAKIITYGNYDLLNQGHINFLRRAIELGDYLIVGVTSDRFDRGCGKLNVRNNALERVRPSKQPDKPMWSSSKTMWVRRSTISRSMMQNSIEAYREKILGGCTCHNYEIKTDFAHVFVLAIAEKSVIA